MHHKNHKHSTSNHSNPAHYKTNNNIPTAPAPGGASTPRKSNFLKTIAQKFKEKPATEDEVRQLGLNAKRETYKTQIQRAKSSRPSRFSGLGVSESRQPSYRKSSRHAEDNSWLFNNQKSESSFLTKSDFGEGLSNMFGGGNQKRGKNQKSGLEDLF